MLPKSLYSVLSKNSTLLKKCVVMDYRKILQEKLIQEIERLAVSRGTKSSLQNAILGSLAFYTYLPIDILNCVPHSAKYLGKVIELSVSSSFYLASLIVLDKVIDNQESVNFETIVEYSFFVKEEAIKKLQDLFGNNTHFWDAFQSLKRLSFLASKLRNKEFDGDDERLLTVLQDKSALVKLYVVSMKAIVQEQIDWDNILESLKHFHIAFQLLDDYEDLKEDVRSGQLNYYLAQEKNVDSENVEIQLKILMASDIVEQGLTIARKNARLSSETFRRMKMVSSQQASNILIKEIDLILTDIHLMKVKAEAKASLSNVLIKEDNQLDLALSSSKSFVYNHQEIDGSWKDFLTLAGSGHNWITAFVITMFAEFDDNRKSLRKAMAWLKDNGGKYNQNIFNDADSMNFYLAAKYMMGETIENAELQEWKSFQHPSGGFSTYVGEAIKDVVHLSAKDSVEGWVTEQNCVSAVACWTSCVIGCHEVFEKVFMFLDKKIDSDGHLSSYWWSEDYYATSFAIMCGFRGKTLEYLLSAQQPAGYWTNFGNPSVFYTAIALKAIEDVYIKEKEIL